MTAGTGVPEVGALAGAAAVRRPLSDSGADGDTVRRGPGRRPGNDRPGSSPEPGTRAKTPLERSAARGDVPKGTIGTFLDELDDDDECPGIAVHCQPVRPNAQTLTWINVSPGESRRVLDHTCAFHTLSYELLSLGGHYIVRRSRSIFDNRLQHAVTVTDYSPHPWRRPEAHRWWTLLIAGAAR